MQHRELGMVMLDRIEKDTEEFANVEQKAKMEGRQLGMMLAPKSIFSLSFGHICYSYK
jgi:translation initiation factor IF-3